MLGPRQRPRPVLSDSRQVAASGGRREAVLPLGISPSSVPPSGSGPLRGVPRASAPSRPMPQLLVQSPPEPARAAAGGTVDARCHSLPRPAPRYRGGPLPPPGLRAGTFLSPRVSGPPRRGINEETVWGCVTVTALSRRVAPAGPGPGVWGGSRPCPWPPPDPQLVGRDRPACAGPAEPERAWTQFVPSECVCLFFVTEARAQ